MGLRNRSIQLLDYQIAHLPVSSGSIFSTALVITSRCATVVFLCSPTSTRGVDPARSCRARAPAVTTNSNELESLLRSITVSYTHLRAHETPEHLVCRLL